MISETTTEDSLLFGGFVFSAMLADKDGTLHEAVCFKMKDFIVSALTFEELVDEVEAAFEAVDGHALRAQHAVTIIESAEELMTEAEMFRLDTLYLVSSEEDRKERQ